MKYQECILVRKVGDLRPGTQVTYDRVKAEGLRDRGLVRFVDDPAAGDSWRSAAEDYDEETFVFESDDEFDDELEDEEEGEESD